jgi:hypothetical protein
MRNPREKGDTGERRSTQLKYSIGRVREKIGRGWGPDGFRALGSAAIVPVLSGWHGARLEREAPRRYEMKKMGKRLQLNRETLGSLEDGLQQAAGGKTALTGLQTSCATCPITCTATEVGCTAGGGA